MRTVLNSNTHPLLTLFCGESFFYYYSTVTILRSLKKNIQYRLCIIFIRMRHVWGKENVWGLIIWHVIVYVVLIRMRIALFVCVRWWEVGGVGGGCCKGHFSPSVLKLISRQDFNPRVALEQKQRGSKQIKRSFCISRETVARARGERIYYSILKFVDITPLVRYA